MTEKFVRKIRRVSTHSYAIVLPKELIKKFGWKERQKIEIIFGGRKHDILIRDWKPGKK
jgi:bifunctional DNA-binding transcriptional regulator/antitoxin component of YhaV-PrlF toxin-antitoxin module